MIDLTDPKTAAVVLGILTAMITGLLALIGTVFAAQGNWRTQREVEVLRSGLAEQLEVVRNRLAEEKDERTARRDYEYDARKRLYQECEPLLFQLAVLSDSAVGRITNLAGMSKQGNLLEDGSGWLASDGYYFKSTAYRLIAPCVIFQLLQRRLTFIDLGLDARTSTQFELARLLYRSFRADFDLASCEPILRYLPDDPDADRLSPSQPAEYYRQGIYAGELDSAVEALIMQEQEQPARLMRYGEFSSAADDSPVVQTFQPVYAAFRRFHPAARPVLWRILVTQMFLYEAARIARPTDPGSDVQPAKVWSTKDAVRAALDMDTTSLSWQGSVGGRTVPDDAITAARVYLEHEISTA